jgi:hypothetical protein
MEPIIIWLLGSFSEDISSSRNVDMNCLRHCVAEIPFRAVNVGAELYNMTPVLDFKLNDFM